MVASLTVVYDPEQKLWKSVNYEYGDFIKQSVGEAFLSSLRAFKDPQKVLEYHFDSAVQKTAQDIYKESVTVAVNLQKLGIRKGDVVLLYSLSNSKMTPLAMGCYLIGAVVSFFDPKMHKENIDPTLANLDPTVILYEQCWSEDLQASLTRNQPPTLKYFLSIDASTKPNVESLLFRPIPAAVIEQFQALPLDAETETAALVLTSGSTGPPKPVALTHALLLNGLKTWWIEPSGHAQPDENSVLFSLSPLRWISQIIFQLFPIVGVKRIMPGGTTNGAYGRDIIQQCRVTHFFTPPSVFHEILLTIPEGSKALDSLQAVQLAGESPTQSLLKQSRKMAPNCAFYCCYGMTEVGSCIATDIHINGGKLNPGLQLKILDEQLQPVGPNVRGQFSIKAPVPFKGYLKVDNSQCIFKDGFFLNGDYGFMDDNNNLLVEARYKDLVRGQHAILIPNNIEGLVMNLPEVSTARLVGHRKSAYETAEVGVLFVLPQKDINAEAHDSVRRKIHKLLATQLTVEELQDMGDIHFVDRMPITSCGKIDRLALKAQLTVFNKPKLIPKTTA